MDENEAAFWSMEMPPISPMIIPKIAFKINYLILLNGYAIASPIIFPILMFFTFFLIFKIETHLSQK